MNTNIGYNFEKNGDNKMIKKNISSTDPSIEPKLFPHLFPDDNGYFDPAKSSITLAQYFRNRLLNYDSRWRDDIYYIFYAYDRMIRERFFRC
ncbi:unnamed protein product [Brachionus calyciflorus]|uniref:Uncharacterized protein n=1 Tax=Brachionus calyciflorus TaxID=104777 RepID=A0A814CNS6_9BILA|nr:unnamed protein product [Brachionus calyciflorus]